MFFRASTRAQAEALGVTGFARNLADGRVEVLACGTEEAVDKLCHWLRRGPPAAEVLDVQIETVDAATLAQWPQAFRAQ